MKIKFNVFVEDSLTERYVEFVVLNSEDEIIKEKIFIVEEETGGDKLWNFVNDCMNPYTNNMHETQEQYVLRFFDEIYKRISSTNWFKELYKKEYNEIKWVYYNK